MNAWKRSRDDQPNPRTIVVPLGVARAILDTAPEPRTLRITLTGLVLRQRKLGLLKHAALSVLPSESENFGLAVAEAMGAGVPVLVGEGAQISDEIERAEAGIRVYPRDAERLADIMLGLLRSTETRAQLGAAGRNLAISKFTWRASTEMMARHYHEIVKATRAIRESA